MTHSPDASERPMAEPTPASQGSDVGGMRATADGGLANSTQRSMEHGDADTPTPAAARDEPASASTRSTPSTAVATPPVRDNNAAWDAADAKDDERHPPVAPNDEGVLDSLGKSISEVVTGAPGTTKAPPGRS